MSAFCGGCHGPPLRRGSVTREYAGLVGVRRRSPVFVGWSLRLQEASSAARACRAADERTRSQVSAGDLTTDTVRADLLLQMRKEKTGARSGDWNTCGPQQGEDIKRRTAIRAGRSKEGLASGKVFLSSPKCERSISAFLHR